MKISTTILAIALAAIFTMGYTQSNAQIIVPKDSTAAADQPIIDDDNTIYTSVKIMPEFPGGEAAMKKYFADKMKSWESTRFISGKVFAQVVIGKDGKVEPESVKLTSNLEPEINEKVVDLVKKMPQWTPGMRYESRSGNLAKVLARVSKTIPIDVSVEGEGEEQVFIIVEHMPVFPGGDIALRKYIAENIKYPEEAKAKKLHGKVFVSFVIDKNGDVVNPKIARGIDPILNAEALRVIKTMPKWEPGSQRGTLVNVSYTVPVNFVME